MILTQIDAITPKIIEFALDGLALRHKAIASNIANINSDNYKPINVSFESQIDSLRSDFNNGSIKNDQSTYQPTISFGKKLQRNESVGIDMSTVQINQNTIQYHALIKGLDYYISTLSIAIKEGRG